MLSKRLWGKNKSSKNKRQAKIQEKECNVLLVHTWCPCHKRPCGVALTAPIRPLLHPWVRRKVNGQLAPVKAEGTPLLNNSELLKHFLLALAVIPLLGGTKTSEMALPRKRLTASYKESGELYGKIKLCWVQGFWSAYLKKKGPEAMEQPFSPLPLEEEMSEQVTFRSWALKI